MNRVSTPPGDTWSIRWNSPNRSVAVSPGARTISQPSSRTIILDGFYVERREDGCEVVRAPGDTATLRFGEFHRIDHVSPGGVLTLFITWRYQGTWGFLVDGRKVPHRDYLSP